MFGVIYFRVICCFNRLIESAGSWPEIGHSLTEKWIFFWSLGMTDEKVLIENCELKSFDVTSAFAFDIQTILPNI